MKPKTTLTAWLVLAAVTFFVAPPAVTAEPAPRLPAVKINKSNQKQYAPHIRRATQKHRLDPALIHAVIAVESGFNPRAVSHAGAMGLMQLMPYTAERFGVSNAFDPVANINAGDTRTHNNELWEPETWPKEAKGAGYMEAPRGALCHWIVIKDEKIGNYQAVVPSTWNAGPRDPDGQSGPYEASLVGHDLADPEQPLEILRTIHSFDPCLACAVHVADKDSQSSVEVKVA